MQIGRSGQSLRGDSLDDVSSNDVFLELRNETFIPSLSYIGDSFVFEPDGRLVGLGGDRGEEVLCQSAGFGNSRLISEREVGGAGVLGAEDVGDDFEGLIDVVVDDKGVDEHEDCFRDVEGIFQFCLGLGFEVLDAVVRDVSDGSSRECGDFGYLDVLEHGELLLEGDHGVACNVITRPSLDHLEGI